MTTPLQRTSIGELGYSPLAATSLGELGGAVALITPGGGLDSTPIVVGSMNEREEAELIALLAMVVSKIDSDRY